MLFIGDYNFFVEEQKGLRQLEYFEYINKICGTDIPREIVTLWAKLFEAFQNFLEEEIGFSKEQFDSKIEKDLLKIVFQEKVNSGEMDSGKYENNSISLKSILLNDKEKLLLILAHELVHMLGKGDNSAGLVKYNQKIPHFIREKCKDHLNGLNRVSYINEMMTEYIAVKVVSKYFDVADNKYSLHFDDGSDAYIISKCISYKEIMIYSETLNYIFDDKLMEVYFEDNFNITDLLNQQKYRYIKKEFSDFYKSYIRYINGIKHWGKPTEVYSKSKFDGMSDAYKNLVEKYISYRQPSKEQLNSLLECLLSNPIYFKGSSTSFYGHFAEEVRNQFL